MTGIIGIHLSSVFSSSGIMLPLRHCPPVRYLRRITILMALCLTIATSLTVPEQLVVSVAKELNVIQCIIEIKNYVKKNDLNLIKALSETDIAASHWKSTDVLSLFASPNFSSISDADVGWVRVAFPRTLFVIHQELFEQLFYFPTGTNDSVTVAYNRKMVVLSWNKFLVLGSINNTFAPINALTIFVSKISEDSYVFRDIYGVKDIQYDLDWGIWNEGKLTVSSEQHHMSGVVLRRQYLEPSNYSSYLNVLRPNQEILDDSASLLNISYELLYFGEAGFMVYDVSDSISAISDLNFWGIFGPTLKFRLFMHIKWMGENPLERYFVHPFDEDLWMTILIWMSVAMIVVTIIYFGTPTKPMHGLLDNMLAVMEAFCNQGGSWDEVTTSARLSRIATWLTVCVVLPSYTAVIMSFMTIRLVQVPFVDFDGLERNGLYRISTEKQCIPLIQAFTSRHQQQIVQKFMLPVDELPEEAAKAVTIICKGRIAHISYGDVVEKTTAPCPIIKIGKPIADINVGIPVTQFPEGYKFFMDLLNRYRMNGMISRFQRKFDTQFEVLDIPKMTGVEMDLVKELFLIYFYAMWASLTVFGVEFLWSIRCKIIRKGKDRKWAKRRPNIRNWLEA